MSTPALQFWPVMRRVERTAWNAVVRCMRAQKLKHVPLPIPVETWIEGPLGVRFAVADLSALGPDVLGRARAREREIEVSQTLADQEARFRYTAAHELGHVLLHGRITSEFREMAGRDFVERRVEREADRFAAAFLMPLPCISTELLASTDHAGLDPQELLRAVREGQSGAASAFRRTVLPDLARRFGVSVTAAAYRFSDIQLATGETAVPFEAVVSVLAGEHAGEVLDRR